MSVPEIMEKIENMSIGPILGDSAYLKPFRMKFTQNGRQRYWDFIKVHNSVAIIIYNIDRDVLVVVKQFRPSVFFNTVQEQYAEDVTVTPAAWTQAPAKLGITLELCAGIMDKQGHSEQETAKEEVLEECGYDVPLDKFQYVTSVRSVGTNGSKMSLFYVEVSDKMKVTEGGGNLVEGELIEVVEMTIPEITDYINQPSIQSPGEFAFAITWFLLNRQTIKGTNLIK